jgi:3D-(3,5/4)-trihydroxycyclohexane-1,2-dione acylhydrolase (decyclizing)
VWAAGGLPGELHKLWRAQDRDAYHVEYGYSCMGYEIAGGLGVKLARPDRDVVVMVGDGSYLMMNSEIATSIAMGLKLTIVLLDNRGFGCINRLQGSCGGESFNNLLDEQAPDIDFAAHARSLGAHAQKVSSIRELEAALNSLRSVDRTAVVVIDTDPRQSTAAGGAWWDVAVPEVSASSDVTTAYETYRAKLADTKKDP